MRMHTQGPVLRIRHKVTVALVGIIFPTQDDEYIILGFLRIYIMDGKEWKEGYESNREKENPSLFFVLFFFPFSFIYYVVESIILSIRK